MIFYQYTFQLAQLPTPIHRWNLPGVPEEFEVLIKRDDLTGASLTGNKVCACMNIYYLLFIEASARKIFHS